VDGEWGDVDCNSRYFEVFNPTTVIPADPPGRTCIPLLCQSGFQIASRSDDFGAHDVIGQYSDVQAEFKLMASQSVCH
jgi:hypothetical protein